MTNEQAKAFFDELDALCVKHGVVLDHEDSHGAAIVREPWGAEEPGFTQAETFAPVRGPYPWGTKPVKR